MTDKNPTYEDMVEIAETRQRENEFFLFYAIDNYATGEGRTIQLFIERNYGEDDALKFIKDQVDRYDWELIQKYSEEDFFTNYSNLIPDQLKTMIQRKDVPMLSFHQSYHFNYS